MFLLNLLATESSKNFNTWGPRQNDRHFPDHIFKYIFVNENVWIWIKISLKFVPNGPVGLTPTRRQAFIWTNDDPVYWRIYASLDLDESNVSWDNFSPKNAEKTPHSSPEIARFGRPKWVDSLTFLAFFLSYSVNYRAL